MIGELIAKAIPWLLPFIIFCSWVYNWKEDSKSGDGGETKKSAPKAKKTEETPPPAGDDSEG